MTRYEFLQTRPLEEVAEFLCQLTDNQGDYEGCIDHCDICIAREYCHDKHNGFLDWLQKDFDDAIWE